MKFQLQFFIRLFSLLLYLCFLSGCEKVEPLATDDFYRFDKLNKLTIKKPARMDFFMGIDNAPIPLNVTAYDQQGNSIDAPQEVISFYSNNVKILGGTFSPDKEGRFAIVGKLANQVSDTIFIRVWDPASLILSLSIVNPQEVFQANGTDTLHFKVDVLKGNQVVDIKFPYNLFVNGKEQTQETFSATVPGTYKFQVKGLGLASNELTINAIPKTTYSVVRLPVIFHEINTSVLTADRIRKLTDDMTRAYRNQFNYNQAAKDPNAEDLFVEFYPAEIGLDGNKLSAPGLHRTSSSKTSFSSNDAFNDAFNSFWDPAHYLNIWVYSNITGDLANSSWAYYPGVTVPMEGFSTFPAGTKPFFPYGIFLNGNHVSINYEGGRTEEILAHEAGHVLGLYHVFDGNNTSFNSCTSIDPDYCFDTPYYNRDSYATTIDRNQRYKRTSCAGIEYTSTNFMDYYYTQNNSFTTEQLKRVRHTINYGLWLPSPYNGSRSARKNGRSSLVERPANLKYIEPVICSMR
ncbi:M43 family zinc metalloprotease [Dyadobacter sp. 3J3]|uniref:M43 family zinc metalloprotease n=1 Tax=Dyadobacter sp. 3J3 TaxID=2606600 RepID=UPI0013576F56|nr:M43 family zinc metalloprotease [Dyadobacter sp. 3J3]